MNLNVESLEAIIPLVAGVFASIVGFKKSCDTPKWKFFRKLRWIGPFLIVYSLFRFAQGASSAIDLNAAVKGMKAKISRIQNGKIINTLSYLYNSFLCQYLNRTNSNAQTQW